MPRRMALSITSLLGMEMTLTGGMEYLVASGSRNPMARSSEMCIRDRS